MYWAQIILGITAACCSILSLIAIEFYRVVIGTVATKTGKSCSAQTQGQIWYKSSFHFLDEKNLRIQLVNLARDDL